MPKIWMLMICWLAKWSPTRFRKKWWISRTKRRKCILNSKRQAEFSMKSVQYTNTELKHWMVNSTTTEKWLLSILHSQKSNTFVFVIESLSTVLIHVDGLTLSIYSQCTVSERHLPCTVVFSFKWSTQQRFQVLPLHAALPPCIDICIVLFGIKVSLRTPPPRYGT